MLVKLKSMWFAPTPRKNLNAIFSTAGRRYKAGIHEMPDKLRDALPSTAEILDDDHVEPAPKPEPELVNLSDFDQERANANAFNEVADAAEAEAEKPTQKAKK